MKIKTFYSINSFSSLRCHLGDNSVTLPKANVCNNFWHQAVISLHLKELKVKTKLNFSSFFFYSVDSIPSGLSCQTNVRARKIHRYRRVVQNANERERMKARQTRNKGFCFCKSCANTEGVWGDRRVGTGDGRECVRLEMCLGTNTRVHMRTQTRSRAGKKSAHISSSGLN